MDNFNCFLNDFDVLSCEKKVENLLLLYLHLCPLSYKEDVLLR